jgi:eukaryotic-like serine/threonine-protein kinase
MVSSSPDKITIPDVSNKTLGDAENALTLAGFSNLAVQQQMSALVPHGYLIYTDPVAGTSVRQDAAITLIVSSGASSST